MALVVFQTFRQVGEVKIDSQGDFYPIAEACGIYSGGFLILCTETKINQFDFGGQLQLSFGARGSGPGEFNSIYGVAANNSYFIVYDSVRMDLSVFDKKGLFLSRSFLPLNFLSFQGNLGFAVNYRRVVAGLPPLLMFRIDDGTIERVGEYFHELSGSIMNFKGGFCQHNFSIDGDDLVVMDGLEQQFWIYDITGTFKMSLFVSLPDFEPMKNTWSSKRTYKEVMKEINKHSMITRIDLVGGGYAISYKVPSSDPEKDFLINVQVVNKDGTALTKKPLQTEDYVLGAWEDLFYTLAYNEEDGGYKLKSFKLVK